jgi:hypothetical protein
MKISDLFRSIGKSVALNTEIAIISCITIIILCAIGVSQVSISVKKSCIIKITG